MARAKRARRGGLPLSPSGGRHPAGCRGNPSGAARGVAEVRRMSLAAAVRGVVSNGRRESIASAQRSLISSLPLRSQILSKAEGGRVGVRAVGFITQLGTSPHHPAIPTTLPPTPSRRANPVPQLCAEGHEEHEGEHFVTFSPFVIALRAGSSRQRTCILRLSTVPPPSCAFQAKPTSGIAARDALPPRYPFVSFVLFVVLSPSRSRAALASAPTALSISRAPDG